jgi:hypothetical protein
MKALVTLLFCSASAFAQSASQAVLISQKIASAGNTIVIQHVKTADSGTTGTVFVDLGSVIHGVGDMLVVGVTESIGTTGVPSITVCDATTNSTCNGVGTTDTFTAASSTCVWGSAQFTGAKLYYAVATNASVRYFGFSTTGANVDETITIWDISGLPTGALDTTACNDTTTPAGASFVSSTYSTAAANEIAIALFGDDNNCSSSFTGTAGTGFTLTSLAGVSCSSMLGASETQIYTSIQSSVTAAINTGNSSGNAHTVLAAAIFK